MKQGEFDFEAHQEPPKREATAAIIERIKKLLRLGADNRGNSHEAERALQLAFELAEKYRVDMAGLDLDEQTEKIIHEHWDMGRRCDRLRRGVHSVLSSFFHVNVILSHPKVIIVGKPSDVLIAHYIHDFLLRAGRNCLRNFEASERKVRRRMTSAKRANYTAGFIWGLFAKLGKSKEGALLSDAQSALVLAEDSARDAYAESTFKLEKVKALPAPRRHRGAAEAGYCDGKSTQINQPLEGSARGALLLNR